MSTLKQVPFFSGLSDEHLAALERCCITRQFGKNSIIINEDEPPDCLYIIKSGRAKVFLCDENGKQIVINTLGAGDYFGELALIDDDPRSASVMTTEPSSLCIMFRDTFRNFLRDDPGFSVNLITDLAKRVRDLTLKVKSFAFDDVYKRVIETLLDLSVEEGGKRYVKEKLTQQEIADRVGASREMVARILKELSMGGYISTEDKSMSLHGKFPSTF